MADKQKKFEWIRYPGQDRGVALGLLVCLTFGTALESPTAGILFGVILGGGIRKERRRRRHELKRERAQRTDAGETRKEHTDKQ